MNEEQVFMPQGEPRIEPMFAECKFTIEKRDGMGGDYERNVGGASSDKRVTFDGYASATLIDALIGAIERTMDHAEGESCNEHHGRAEGVG